MQITMIGIDHSLAAIEYRELFAFTKAGALAAMSYIKEAFHLEGCILLSTCNRTELWVSSNEEPTASLYEMLCKAKKTEDRSYEAYFTKREGEEALSHLLTLTCGLDSKIFGEDQIISQVRQALALARECHCEDSVLERAFQGAIGAAKKVKSTVRLTSVDTSTAYRGVELLREKLGSLKDVPCLVIGNGQMGKLVSADLLSHGAQVSMTLRKRIHGREEQGSVSLPRCTMIPYEDRITALESYQVVISATLSPHFTIRAEDLKDKLFLEDSIWLDLAVPRDIDPHIKTHPSIHLYDMDTLGDVVCRSVSEAGEREARRILEDCKEELCSQFAFRKQVPAIELITKLAAMDTKKRLEEPLTHFLAEEAEKQKLAEAIRTATEKSVGKLLFGLRETLPENLWGICMEALSTAAQKDTLKTGRPKGDII